MDFFNVDLQALQTQYQASQPTVHPHQLTHPAITIELVTQNIPNIVAANPAPPPVAMNLVTAVMPLTPFLGPQNPNTPIPNFVLAATNRKRMGA